MEEQLQKLRRKLHGIGYAAAKNGKAFGRWCFFAVLVGVIVGLVGVGFHHALSWAGTTFQRYRWLLFLLPLAGLFIAFWYAKMQMPLERGTNYILTSVRQDHPVPLRLAPSIFLTSFLTHLCGGSAGREGAALQLGGAISFQLGHLLRLDDKDSRIITMCGMAAGFSALFGTPITATVFSMEVISVGVMYYAALFPCMLAAAVAHGVALRFGGESTAFVLHGIPDQWTNLLLVQLILFGIACAILSIVVCVVFHRIGHLLKHYLPNQYVCIAVGGALVALASLLCNREYNGAGMAVIERACEGQATHLAFFLKLLFTAVTIGVGYKGGEIVPVLFIGATFGAAYGSYFGLAPSFAAGLGMTAVFCGVVNSPLTSVMLSYELFGGESLGMFGVVISVAYMLSGYYGLYSEQKILYSKLKPQFIDRKTK